MIFQFFAVLAVLVAASRRRGGLPIFPYQPRHDYDATLDRVWAGAIAQLAARRRREGWA